MKAKSVSKYIQSLSVWNRLCGLKGKAMVSLGCVCVCVYLSSLIDLELHEGKDHHIQLYIFLVPSKRNSKFWNLSNRNISKCGTW